LKLNTCISQPSGEQIMDSVLFVGAHPDDVETGALGLLLNLSARAKVHYLVMSKCQDIPRNTHILDEYMEVTKRLHVSSQILDLPNRQIENHGQEMRDVLERYRDSDTIRLVACPSINDIHQDHKAVADEVVRVFRHSTVLFFEVPHSCPFFEPRFFYPLNESTAQKKLEIVGLYKSQRAQKYVQADAILGTMRMRGVQCGSEYAEAYEVWRIVGGLSV